METKNWQLLVTDLHNPRWITGFYHKGGYMVEADKDQGFQEYPNSFELWQVLPDGRLMLVKRWHKSTALYFQTKFGNLKTK